MSRDMLWGYFFRDSNISKLKPLRKLLITRGYEDHGFFHSEDGEAWLHVSRVENLTADGLFFSAV